MLFTPFGNGCANIYGFRSVNQQPAKLASQWRSLTFQTTFPEIYLHKSKKGKKSPHTREGRFFLLQTTERKIQKSSMYPALYLFRQGSFCGEHSSKPTSYSLFIPTERDVFHFFAC